MSMIMRTHQRGSTLRCNISLSRFASINTELTTETIKVGDLALAVIKCKNKSTTDIEVSVQMIKNKSTRKCTIHVKCQQFSRLICLYEDWVETVILITSHNGEFEDPYDNTRVLLLYLIEVNFTALEDEESFMPMFVNKQLYEDVESTDFQLQTADGSVAVHKAVLFIHSDMFRTMFRGEWKETGEGRIKLDGVTAQTLQNLKVYMYLGTLPDEGLEPLLLFASCYMMDNLREACVAKLVKTIKPEKFDDIVEFAVQNNIGDLVRSLIMEIPDDLINKVHELKQNSNKNDNNENESK